MKNNINQNAYLILGLDVSASQKEIRKRAEEIIKRIDIDDTPKYDNDVPHISKQRSKDTVAKAQSELLDPKRRLVHYFFNYNLTDEDDEEAFSAIKDDNYDQAIKIWSKESDGIKNLLHKKNLAILYCHLLLIDKEQDSRILTKSIVLWKEVITSEAFWKAYFKLFRLNDDTDTSEDSLDSFKNEIKSYLSDIYDDISSFRKEKEVMVLFMQTFNIKSKRLQEETVNPLVEKIHEDIKVLEDINSSITRSNAKDKLDEIIDAFKRIQRNFSQIKKLDFYEDSQIKVIRDKVSTVLNQLGLTYNNTLDDYLSAKDLGKEALAIAGTEAQRQKVTNDLDVFKKNIDGEEIKDVLELIQKGEIEDAISLIDEKLQNKKLSKENRETLLSFKKSHEERTQQYGKVIKSAPTMYTLNGFGTKVYGDTLYFTALFIPVLPLARYSVTHLPNGTYQFHGKLPLRTGQKWWLGIGIVIILFFIFRIFTSSGTSNVIVDGYSCSQDNASKAQAMAPDPNTKSQLETEVNALNAESSRLDTEYYQVNSYNEYSVNSYNAQVDSFKARKAAYESNRTAYNNSVDTYNNFLETNCTKQ